MTMRYLAGALGISFIPVKSAIGSDIADKWGDFARQADPWETAPFTGERYVLLPACTPDVAVILVPRADEAGNCQIDGSGFADEYIAKASRRVILVTEALVSDDAIRQQPQSTVIPAYRVDAVVHQPWGAYPTSVPGRYDYDYEALNRYQAQARSPEDFKAFLDEYVFGTDSFDAYLDRVLTPVRMQQLVCDPRLGYSSQVAAAVTSGGRSGQMPAGFTRNEMMIVTAAHQIRDGEVAIIGTGLPMAATGLAIRTHAPNLNYVVETGIGDVRPAHACLSVADTRLLGAARPAFVRDIVESLGFLVQRGLADLGFLGGAQIDMYGNLNATATGDYLRPEKRFPGSGGANPIASCAKRFLVIMQQERRRFVERVDYITSPGHLSGGTSRQAAGLRGGGPDRVITDLAIMDFEPDSKRMRVISLHPGVTREQVQAATGFELIFAPEVALTPAPSAAELEILRTCIGRVYLGG